MDGGSSNINRDWLSILNNLFVRSDLGHLFKSSDGGKTWKNITNLLANADVPGKPYLNKTGVSSINWNNRFGTSHVLVALSYKMGFWISYDLGESWKWIDTNQHYPSRISFHPYFVESLLTIGQPSSCFDDPVTECYNEAMVSRDEGLTWYAIIKNYRQGVYGNVIKDPEELWVLVYEKSFTDKDFNKRNSYFYKSEDLGKSEGEIVYRNVHRLYLNSFYAFVSIFENPNSDHVTLKATNNLEVWFDVNTPTKIQYTNSNYFIMYTSGGATFLAIRHDNGQDKNKCTIYVANTIHDDFIMSIDNVYCNEEEVDFRRLYHGIYIANVANSDDNTKLTTKISFDNGGLWRNLNYNSSDCQNCNLHLSGVTEWAGVPQFGNASPWHSSWKVPGLLLSTGSYGDYLEPDVSKRKTFMSRNAGLDWFKIHDDMTQFDISDWGAITMIGDTTKSTNELLFSEDEGSSWVQCLISSEINIDNIAPNTLWEGDSVSEMLVYGTKQVNGSTQGVLLHVDFTDLFDRVCVGENSPGTNTSDYEMYYLSDTPGGQCLLGYKVGYIRRKAGSKCQPKAIIQTQLEYCPCKREDYECDDCYVLNNITNLCVLDKSCSPPNPEKPCLDGATSYTITKGYKKVAYDMCIENPNSPSPFAPITEKCTDKFRDKTKTFLKVLVFLLLAIIVVISILFVIFFAYSKSKLPCKPKGDHKFVPVNQEENL